MKEESKKQSRIIQRSGWSAFSLLAFLIFGIGVPALLFLMGEDLSAKVGVEAGSSLPMLIAIAWLVVALITLWVLVHNAKQTKYHWEGNVIVCENGKVFSGMVENKRFIFTPGMSVYVQQSLKGKFFRYGNVCITMGMATAGEFRMEHVKRPNKVKKYLAKYLMEYSYSPAYTSAPFIVNPYAYANMFPGFYGMGMYPYGYMMPQANANGQVGAFPYSAAYGTAGTASPYNF